MSETPYLVKFIKIGNSSDGYISVAEKQTLPFEVKRIHWTYFTPEKVERGRHAHYELKLILVAVSGRIIVTTEMPGGKIEKFILETPDEGLYIPKHCWHKMQYSHNAVQLCMANMEFNEDDYIRDYNKFLIECK